MGIILMNYSEEIKKSMTLLSKINNCIFLGQSIEYPGNLIYKTTDHLSNRKKIEMPVFEETQMGMSIGLSLGGFLPISCYPRFDFLLLSFNQLINHLDKYPIMTNGEIIPKVIIRVSVGSSKPLDAGEQHTQDYSKELKSILKTVKVYQLKDAKSILPSYKRALKDKYSSLMVEYSKFM
jgi:pyruvate/2-oxoglutarate/acetoin dehydrogenase E1 component